MENVQKYLDLIDDTTENTTKNFDSKSLKKESMSLINKDGTEA